MTKQFVDLYTVQFQGTFGRNRTPKFTTTKEVELTSDASEVIESLVDAQVTAIKPKKGTFRVVKYANSEANTYIGKDGEEIKIYTIPIGQGVTVYTRKVGQF